MTPRNKLPEEFRRSVMLNVAITKSEAEELDRLVKENHCRDRSDYVRKTLFEEMHKKETKK